MSKSTRERGHGDWGDRQEQLYAALTARLGPASGTKGRSTKAYREAARRLAAAGVDPEALDVVLRDFAVEHLKTLGPMPLAAFADGRHRVTDLRRIVVARWANGCVECGDEVRRGALAWFRRPPEGGTGYLTCSACEPLDHGWERAQEARRWALEKDDDPEGLLEAILRETPEERREAVEDSLPTEIFVTRELGT
jgi:hypothetical protein